MIAGACPSPDCLTTGRFFLESLVTQSSAVRHGAFTAAVYTGGMKRLPGPVRPCTEGTLPGPLYRVLVTATDEDAGARIRQIVEAKRGELKSLGALPRLDYVVHLGRRRVDDVLAAFEGAGFAVRAVVALGLPAPGWRFVEQR